jgi:AmiR/NasT family two-component response regulator
MRERIDAARAEVEANMKRLDESRLRLAATREKLAGARSEREALHESAFARLQAKLDSLPVIEQAKGILIARSGCQPEEAFDILRRASQRSNVKVRDLAAEIVARAARNGERPARTDSRLVRPPGPAERSAG